MKNINNILFINLDTKIIRDNFSNIYDNIHFTSIDKIHYYKNIDILVINTDGLDLSKDILNKIENYFVILIDDYSYIDKFIEIRKNHNFHFIYNDKEGKYLNLLEYFINRIDNKKKNTLKIIEENNNYKYKFIIETSPLGFIIADIDGNITDLNNKVLEILGSPSSDETKKVNLISFSLLKKSGLSDSFLECIKLRKIIINEMNYTSKWGKNTYIKYYMSPLIENNIVIGVQSILEDITEKRNYELKLINSLEEKEIMLKEIHHRVKNNLQIISSLLNLQQNYIDDEKAKQTLLNVRNRIKSMSLVHEKLYASNSLDKINIKNYIFTLLKNIFTSYLIGDKKINYNIECDDEIFFNVEYSINIGLIINEIVSNSLKHAFDDRNSGNINIRLKKENEDCQLTIEDDGIGISNKFNTDDLKTLGINLIHSFINQINAQMNIESIKGSKFTIAFRY